MITCQIGAMDREENIKLRQPEALVLKQGRMMSGLPKRRGKALKICKSSSVFLPYFDFICKKTRKGLKTVSNLHLDMENTMRDSLQLRLV